MRRRRRRRRRLALGRRRRRRGGGAARDARATARRRWLDLAERSWGLGFEGALALEAGRGITGMVVRP